MLSNKNISSTEKQSPNIYNMQPNQQVNLCICGKVVFNRPITLSCGHQYHFKCARDFIFSSKEETEENQCHLCQLSNQQSFQVNDSCDINEEKSHINKSNDSNEFDNQVQQSTLQSKNNLNTSYQKNTLRNSQEKSFKYTTPSTSKYPKQSRYSSYQDSDTHKKTSTNDFMISPIYGMNKNPFERVPFSDITCKINKTQPHNNLHSLHQQLTQRNQNIDQSFKDNCNKGLLNYNEKQQENYFESIQQSLQNIQPFHCYSNEKSNNIFQRQNQMNYIEVLGEKIINRSQELQGNSFYSEEHSVKIINNEFIGVKINDSDILKNNSLSDMSLKSNSILSDNRFFQTAELNGLNLSCALFKQKKMNQMRQFLSSSQVESNSYNNSMVSNGSDKENARNIITKRTRNNILQVSFFEGLSFLCQSSLYTQIPEQKTEQYQKNSIKQYFLININQQNYNDKIHNSVLQLPLCVELQNLYNQDKIDQFRNVQDILVIIVHDGMNSDQRYQLMNCFFDQIDQYDSLAVAWVDSKTKQVYKNQSDYFFGKEMSEIISKEFMRLQGHKETSFKLIDDNFKEITKNQVPIRNDMKQKQTEQRAFKTLQQFVEEQYSMIQNKRMIQHLVIIQPEQQNDVFKESSLKFDNVLVSSIILQPSLYQITKPDVLQTEFSKLISDTLKRSRSINIKSIKLSFEINPFLNNFIDFNLINANQLQAKVQKTTTRCFQEKPKSSENLISEKEELQYQLYQDDNKENIHYDNGETFSILKKFVDVSINFLRENKIELLFEASFNKSIDPSYNTAKLFNCSISYKFLCEESQLLSFSSCNSLFGSINSESYISQSQLNADIKQIFPLYKEINQQLSNLYFLFSWNKDSKHLNYNRRVLFSFWKHEVENKTSNYIQKFIFDKYKSIFEAISTKKQTTDFEEYHQFNLYYSNN